MSKDVLLTDLPMFCPFNIYKAESGFTEKTREIDKEHHTGMVHEMQSSDGISLGYYNVSSKRQGRVLIDNRRPFIQCSYTLSGKKTYAVDNGRRELASFSGHEYNYLFLNEQEIALSWQPGERLEIFELGVSPELFLHYLPEEHAFYKIVQNNLQSDMPAAMSGFNMPLSRAFSDILYQMLRCPLEGRYKELFIKSKTMELMAYQLEQYEQLAGTGRPVLHDKGLKKEDIDRMHHARSIILANLDSPCSLIDLAHQVGTNEAYLKKYFKQVFGNTVFGYLQTIKMNQAHEMLQQGRTVAQVADHMGYKHPVHFARAFKKHFGYPPNTLKR